LRKTCEKGREKRTNGENAKILFTRLKSTILVMSFARKKEEKRMRNKNT